MARLKDKDLYKYHKIDTQFNDHYLNGAFNATLDLVEKKGNGNEEMVMANLMNCVNSTVRDVKDKEAEIKKLETYNKYLQDQIKELLIKTK